MLRSNRFFLPFIGFLLTILIMQTTGWAAEDANWRLEDCIQQGLNTSPRLRSTSEQLIRAEAGYREDRANRLGTVDITGNYSHNTEVQELSLVIPLPTGVVERKMSFGDGNNFDFAATAKLPLYTGGAISNRIRASEADRAATSYDLAADSASFVAEIRRAFFNALGAQQAVKICDLNVFTLTRHHADVAKMVEVGVGTEEQLTMAEAAVLQAEAAQAAAHSELIASQFALGNLIGLPGQLIDPTGDLTKSLFVNDITTSWNDRPEVKSIELRLKQSLSSAAVAKASFLPNLSAMAAYHYAKPGVDAISNKWMDYAIVGANLSWTLWDGKARQQRLEKSISQTRTVREKQIELRNALQSQFEIVKIRSQYADHAKTYLAKRAEAVSKRAEMVQTRYKTGSATEQEWLDAYDEANAAQLALNNGLVRLRIAEIEYLYTIAK
ncbi:MAG: TolC family protein [bacterium]|nr:TolC family protein [bacterium]